MSLFDLLPFVFIVAGIAWFTLIWLALALCRMAKRADEASERWHGTDQG